MSEQTTNLRLPYIMAAQAQKHVTHNEALRALDALVQISVIDRDITAPPTAPENGDCYIVGPAGTEEWSGHDAKLAAFQDDAWEFYEAGEGWLAWVCDEAELVCFDGTTWNAVSGESETLEKLGINATADNYNRLSVNSEALLFNHSGASVRAKLNKNSTSDTASLIFQTGFSGRAEFGITGDDDFHMKVSSDGSTFLEGLQINAANGIVSQPRCPVFYAYGVSNTGVGTIKFHSVKVNVGGHYDKLSGQFTAPVAGIYEFSFALLTNSAFSGQSHVYLRKNDVNQYGRLAYETCSAGKYEQTSATIILDLSAADTITLYNPTSSQFWAGQDISYFTGKKIA